VPTAGLTGVDAISLAQTYRLGDGSFTISARIIMLLNMMMRADGADWKRRTKTQ
jgi:hypothetical protein